MNAAQHTGAAEKAGCVLGTRDWGQKREKHLVIHLPSFQAASHRVRHQPNTVFSSLSIFYSPQAERKRGGRRLGCREPVHFHPSVELGQPNSHRKSVWVMHGPCRRRREWCGWQREDQPRARWLCVFRHAWSGLLCWYVLKFFLY